MPTFNITAPDGTKYTVEGPEGATEQQALEKVKAQHQPAGKLERLGQGFMDPIYGAAQVGARMSEPGEEIGAAIMGKEGDHSQRIETVDRTVKERLEKIQERRWECRRRL